MNLDWLNFVKNLKKKREIKRQILSEQTREMLLSRLRGRWNEINVLYQKTTHRGAKCSDSQVKQKEQFEKILESIEKDIKQLSCKRIMIDLIH